MFPGEHNSTVSFEAGPGGKIQGGKDCKDLHGRTVKQGTRYVPGPDTCTLCVCDAEGPIWCRAVLCSPPKECKSVRAVNTCCEFICLDDTATTGGPFGPPGAVDIADIIPKIVIASVCSMLSLALLLFLVYRLRQKHLQGRMNSAEARRSAQMCDECDDTRSLDFSNDCYFERPGVHPHMYPPHYLASWKPPSSYFPPRGEAPPPYEEAIATTSNCVIQAPTIISPVPPVNSQNILSSSPVPPGGNTIILTNENIQNPANSPQLPLSHPVSAVSLSRMGRSVDCEHNASGTDPLGCTACVQPPLNGTADPSCPMDEVPGPSRQPPFVDDPSNLQLSRVTSDITGICRSCSRELNRPSRPHIDRNPPDYAAVIRNDLPPYSAANCRDCFRHSLTLPRHPNDILDFGLGLPMDYSQRIQQRYSLQFNVADWSSSSSTLSLSSPNTPDGLRPSSSMSSSSSSSSNITQTTH